MSNWRIPLSDLAYDEAEEKAVLRIVRGRWLSMGPEVETFEQEFAAEVGVKHAFAVSSGTAALHLALIAADVKQGDEVIQPAINFVATANMTLAVGAVPIFADIINLSEPTIDPAEIERQISPKTKAVVVMHYGGALARMTEIAALCTRHRLPLIEDACHAVGATYVNENDLKLSNRKAGSLSDVGCFSFFSNKNLAVGEGGMITTNNDEMAAAVRLLRSHGMTTLTWDRHRGHASSYDVVTHGYNYRLDEIRAAIGRVQLNKLAESNKKRSILASIYRERLKDLNDWIIPFDGQSDVRVFHLMVVVAPDSHKRHLAAEILKQAGIQTSLHYPCITSFQGYRTYESSHVIKSPVFASRVLTLPLYPGLQESQVHEICDLICQVAF